MADSFKKDPYFKVKLNVKYRPKKQLGVNLNVPIKRKLK